MGKISVLSMGNARRWQLTIGALITYGSLYPFSFSWPESLVTALAALVTESSLWSSRGDVAGNVLIFLPWGLLQAGQSGRQYWHWQTFVSGLLLALVLQILQTALPSRDAALSDVFWNTVGILIGQLLLAPIFSRLMAEHRSSPQAGQSVLLSTMWLTVGALPLVPSLDWQALKNQLQILLTSSSWSTPDFLLNYGSVLVIACSFISAKPTLRSLIFLAVILFAAVTSKLFTLHNALYQVEVVAWVLAWITAVLIRHQPHRIALLAFAVILTGWTASQLEPFSFAQPASDFGLVPFAAYLEGNMLGNIRELANTLWLTTAMLWLTWRIGGSMGGIGIFLTGWITLLEVIQMWVIGRSADITLPITTLIASLAIRSFLQRSHPSNQPITSEGTAHRGEDAPLSTTRRRIGSPAVLIGLTIWICSVLAMASLIKHPAAPYNLRELFLADGHPLAIAVFTLALFWTGAGTWLALRIANHTSAPWLVLPGTLILSAAFSLLLLLASVTEESLMDIAGSSNLHWMVINKNIWGPWWAEAFKALNQPDVIATIERFVRYIALYIPATAILAIALLAVSPSLKAGQANTLKASLALLPLMWLCKAIAFDWSSTDNLNELIATSGPLGLGGGTHLYLLLVLTSVNVAVIANTNCVRSTLFALLASVLCLPASWWLLTQGLSPAVQKYGLFFSGVQFLLGPDRSTNLTETALMARWLALYLSLLMFATVGVRLGKKLLP